MQFSNRQIFLIMVGVVGVAAIIFFVIWTRKTGPGGSLVPDKKDAIRLVVWGVDPPKAFSAIKDNFEKLHKGVDIKYAQIDPNQIQQQLVNALALNQGPDVVMVKNRTLSRQKNFLLPVPTTRMSLNGFRNYFPTVVEQDFVDNAKQIYGLPLSVDTLALVYNKDFLDQARIIAPPATWGELSDMIPQLVDKGTGSQINRAAVGLGGSMKSMTNAGDILPLLFLQNGLTLAKGNLDKDNAGLRVFSFYSQFSNPRSLAYTWSDLQPNDLQGFAERRSVMAFAYKRQLAAILNQNPFLNYRVAPMLQTGANRVDYADYWALAVTRDSKQSALAWDFVIYATTVPENATAYMQATKYPPALLSLLKNNYDSQEYGVFAKQALTARSWPAADDKATRMIFSDMIGSYLTGQVDEAAALGRAESLLGQNVTR